MSLSPIFSALTSCFGEPATGLIIEATCHTIRQWKKEDDEFYEKTKRELKELGVNFTDEEPEYLDYN